MPTEKELLTALVEKARPVLKQNRELADLEAKLKQREEEERSLQASITRGEVEPSE